MLVGISSSLGSENAGEITGVWLKGSCDFRVVSVIKEVHSWVLFGGEGCLEESFPAGIILLTELSAGTCTLTSLVNSLHATGRNLVTMFLGLVC